MINNDRKICLNVFLCEMKMKWIDVLIELDFGMRSFVSSYWGTLLLAILEHLTISVMSNRRISTCILFQQQLQHLKSFHKVISIPFSSLLQGPKLRVGTFGKDKVTLVDGQTFVFDMSDEPGDSYRVKLPHPEILNTLRVGDFLLLGLLFISLFYLALYIVLTFFCVNLLHQ